MTNTADFAAILATLYVAHSVGDHWVQTHHQACAKGAPTIAGRLACLRHVVTLTLTKVIALAALVLATDLKTAPLSLLAGLTVDALSHYWADRRTPLARFAELIGKGDFFRMGLPRPGTDDAPHLGTGAYALDQSWHHLWLFIAALIITA
ncbi:DUF3307 domain-containing protein [Planomonospora venezuelensis]|uniref:Uncharacterized protein n=1 Tax=Planomonospora venezuelensis TaxID=1999 RepID=A0A841DB60_PLAVE|nr:DUF3307 domain-containing protein [Planomonospora venezuelensis]MBB5967882.1 hypothetical protein [Planomonospora venezuelensis]GIN03282.1 hypothetical protein Pve01_49400 [Planomonospora venezuelensis]